MKITTKRLILRDLTIKDKESFIKNINNLNVSKYMAVVPYPYTKKDFIWWVKECRKPEKNKNNYDFNIQLKGTKEIIGAVGISKINKFDGTATMGYWLGEEYWKKGIMSEAVKTVLDFCFNQLKLRRIDVSASPKNKASNALIKKMGFKYEGMKRKSLRSKSTGKVRDQNIYGLLKEEWIKHRKKLK